MLELTFAEQVKIVLGRKNMTIKQLAEEIEEKTGMKMSRQNLTQRLGRDNFQEKDMKLIAEILGCPYKLSILEDMGEATTSTVREVVKEVIEKPVQKVVEKPVEKVVQKEVQKEVTREKNSRDVGPIREIIKKPMIEIVKPKKPENQREITVGEITTEKVGELNSQAPFELTEKEINPYTGYEYKTNTVRVHPTRIGYVQVYNRVDHKWAEMTEWAFLGYQERLKLSLGKAYQEPTYLD